MFEKQGVEKGINKNVKETIDDNNKRAFILKNLISSLKDSMISNLIVLMSNETKQQKTFRGSSTKDRIIVEISLLFRYPRFFSRDQSGARVSWNEALGSSL